MKAIVMTLMSFAIVGMAFGPQAFAGMTGESEVASRAETAAGMDRQVDINTRLQSEANEIVEREKVELPGEDRMKPEAGDKSAEDADRNPAVPDTNFLATGLQNHGPQN